MQTTRERLHRRLGVLMEAAILGTVATSVLWLGGVTTSARFALELSIAALLLLAAIREGVAPHRAGRRLALFAAAPLLLLSGIAFVQTVPMPSSVVSKLAPGRTRLEAELRPEGSARDATATVSVDPAETRSHALWLAALAGFVLVSVRVASDRAACRRLGFGLAGVAGAAAALGIAQLLLGEGKILFSIPPPQNAKPFGPFVNRNHFAGLMELGLAAALGWLIVEASRFIERTSGLSARARIAAIGDREAAPLVLLPACALVIAGAVLVSQSRAGIAACLLVALVAAGACLVASGSRRAALGLVLAGVAASAALVAWIGPGHVLERFGDVPQANARLSVWRDCLGVAAGSPILGTGIGTFASVYPAYQSVPAFLRFAHAESDWWQLLVEGGGLALFAASVGLPVIAGRIARAWRDARSSSRTRILCLAAGVAAVVLHGFVDVGLHIPGVALAFLLAVSVLLGEASAAIATRRAPARAA
jgi:O-antigen ligase